MKKIETSTAPGIPKRSPIQVLTGPDVAWLPGADETGYFLRGMAVDIIFSNTRLFIRITNIQMANFYPLILNDTATAIS